MTQTDAPQTPEVEVEVFGAQPEHAFGGKQFSVRRFTLAAGTLHTERYAVPPDYVLIASADDTDNLFDVCFGDAFIFESSLRIGLGGRAILPAVAPALTFRGGAADSDIVL